MADLVVDVGGVAEGAGHLFAQHRAETLAQAVHGHFDRSLGHSEPLGYVLVADFLALTGEESLQQLETLLATLAGVGAQAIEDLLELRCGPAAIEFLLGGALVRRLDVVAALGGLEVERQRRGGATAFLRLLPVPLVGGVVLQGGEQERAEAAALLVRRLEIALVE